MFVRDYKVRQMDRWSTSFDRYDGYDLGATKPWDPSAESLQVTVTLDMTPDEYADFARHMRHQYNADIGDVDQSRTATPELPGRPSLPEPPQQKVLPAREVLVAEFIDD